MVKLIFCFAVICCSIPSLNAQEIGIFTGPSFHKFYTPAKEHMGVSEKFEAASGIVLGLSFKLKSDTSLFYSLLVDSKKQTGYAEVFYESGHASSYSYLEFALHNISLSYLLNLDLFKIKKVLKSRLCAGPSLTCIAAAKSDGHGYNNIFTNQVGTSGVSHTSIQGVYWSVTDNRSGYFRQFGFGLTGGIDFSVAVTNRLNIELINRIHFILTNISDNDKVDRILLNTYYPSVGLSLKL